MNRAERQHRIAKDDGDPDDTVYVKRTRRNNDSKYHESTSCKYIPSGSLTEHRPLPRKVAQDRLFPPCRLCVLNDVEYDYNGNTGPWLQLLEADP